MDDKLMRLPRYHRPTFISVIDELKEKIATALNDVGR
jgi:hypothetical protein